MTDQKRVLFQQYKKLNEKTKSEERKAFFELDFSEQYILLCLVQKTFFKIQTIEKIRLKSGIYLKRK